MKLEAGPNPLNERSRTHQQIRLPPRPNGGDGNGGDGRRAAAARQRASEPKPPRRRVRIRKLRLLLLLVGLGILAAVSTVFGMMMAVASDLPKLELEDRAQLEHRRQERPGPRPADRQPEAASSCARRRSRP